MKKLAAFATVFFAAAVSLHAAPPQDGASDRGRATFKRSCGPCHGEDATGGKGPDLIRSSLVRHDENGDLIGPVVTAGRSDKGMPPFPLTAAQISDLVAFLQSQIALFDLHTRLGTYPNDIPAERLATGSVEAGKAYFNGPGGCAGCHSVTGDLAGIATRYNPADLEIRFLYPYGAPETAVVTPPSGQILEGTLLLNDEFYIAIRGADGWYRSWPADTVKVEVHDPLAAHAELLKKYTNSDMHNLFTYLETLR